MKFIVGAADESGFAGEKTLRHLILIASNVVEKVMLRCPDFIYPL